MNIFTKLFSHKHNFRYVRSVFHSSKFWSLSAEPVTAKIYRCKCGAEERRLTPAGYQQISWGDSIEEVTGVRE